MRSYLFFLSSSFWIAVVAGFVVVTFETGTEATRAVVTTRIELIGKQPLLIKSAIVGKVVHGLLEEAVALHPGAFLSTMAELVNESISKRAFFVTVIVISKVTIRVGLLEGESLHLDVGLEVGVLEGGGEGTAVGGPGRQLAAVGRDREHGDTGPRLRDGVHGAGSVLGPRREAWRRARR